LHQLQHSLTAMLDLFITEVFINKAKIEIPNIAMRLCLVLMP